jgi:autotransporter-associated beta strand protein
MENLGRGVVAVRSSATDVFVSWRLLGFESQDLPFNIYRSAAGGPAVRLNDTPLTGGTNYIDSTANPAVANAYFVRPVINGLELPTSASFTLPANAPLRPYTSLPLRSTPWATYVHLVWVGDLDGDGEYDFVVSRLPLEAGRPAMVDAYKRDGTFLWRVDFGANSVDPDNIEPPASSINAGHNDGVTVYDLDSDGRAEVVIKSANGVVFGNGQTLTHGDNVTQFISVLDGLTGAERARAPVPTDYIADGPVAGHFGIAYLDGVNPSFIFKAKNRIGSGAFNLFIAAWDFDGTNLTQRWKWLRGNNDAPDFHQIRIVDVDRDGRDEICDGGYVIDDDGTMLYTLGSQGVIHGDRFHIGDLDPDRPGLEGFGIQQNNGSGLLYYTYDAATGEMINRHFGGVEDTARGTAADITPGSRGYEYWSFHGIHEFKTGAVISPNPQRPWPNFRIWWDGDVLSENLNREMVEKWNPLTGGTGRLINAADDSSVDSWRDAAQFYGDILGDWREEVVFEKSDHTALLIYTTPIPTSTRLYTLPHNPEYRLCFTVKGYLQSNMIDYYLGDGMAPPPMPAIVPVLGANPSVPAIVSFSEDTGESTGDGMTRDNLPTLNGIGPIGAQIVVSRIGGSDDGLATADAAGKWSFSYTQPLTDGTHYFLARLNDGLNNMSMPFSIQIDTSPAPTPVIETAVIGESGGLTIHGSADAGLRVEISIEGVGLIGTTIADGSGRWSVAHATALGSQSYTLSALTKDTAGNPSAPATRIVDLGINVPALTVMSDDTGVSATDRITSDRTLVLSGMAAPDAAVSIYRFDTGTVGTITANSAGEWVFDYTSQTLPDGVYTFTAFSGNSLGAQPFTVTVDGAAPAISAIDRIFPATASASSTTVTFRAAFSEAVAGVDAGDFTAVFGGGLSGSISGVGTASSRAYDVTVSPLTGEGTVRLDLNASSTGITDLAGNALSVGFSAGQVFTRVLVGNGVWVRTSEGGLWSENSNWLGGIEAHGAGTTADFSTLEISDDIRVHLDTPRTVTNLVFGDDDPTSVASWIIDSNGNSANILTLVTGAAVPAITVNPLGTNARAIISAPLAGTNGFNKAGAGTLVLSGSSALTGVLGVNAGVLRVETGGRITPGAVTVSGFGSALTASGGSIEATGAANVNNSGNLIVDTGLASFSSISANNSSGNAVRVNGGRFVTGSISFMRSTDGNLNYNTGFIVKGGEAQVGSITLGTNNSNAMMSVEGGTVTVTGPLALGNQSSGGRGGHLRVTGGMFRSTDSSSAGGLILPRRNNNSSTANFLGGMSVVERIVLGFDSTVAAGVGTVNVNGGELYVGSGGIVKNGGTALMTTINLTSGALGAKANWSSNLPMTLGGNLTLKAADENLAPFAITLGGVLSGPGGFIKTGAGTVTLNGANTFAGAVSVDTGTLAINGSLGAGATVTVANGGVLAGTGNLSRTVALENDGRISPGNFAMVGTLTASSLTWNGGGKGLFDLGVAQSSDAIVVSSALTKGGAGTYEILVNPIAGFAAGQTYTLATFASSNFVANDFTVSGLPSGTVGTVSMEGTQLRLSVSASPSYADWAAVHGLPSGLAGPGDDADGDGSSNLLEYFLGSDPVVSVRAPIAMTLEGEFHVFRFTRSKEIIGVNSLVEVSADLFTWAPSSVAPILESATATAETWVVKLPISSGRHFARLVVSLP